MDKYYLVIPENESGLYDRRTYIEPTMTTIFPSRKPTNNLTILSLDSEQNEAYWQQQKSFKFFDLVVTVNEHRYAYLCNAALLASNSTFFENMLTGGFAESVPFGKSIKELA